MLSFSIFCQSCIHTIKFALVINPVVGWLTVYEVHTISFQTFVVWALLLIVHTWNSSPLRSNLIRLQCTCCTVLTTSSRPHRSLLVWACQWPSSQPLSSPHLSHNDSFWALGITKSHMEQVLDYMEVEELSWCPSCSNSLWQGWSCGLVHCPGGNATDPIWRVQTSSNGISSWNPWCIVLVEMLLTLFEECRPLPTESLPEIP